MTDIRKLLAQEDKIMSRLWPVIKRELGGQGSEVQGAVLADMAAIWIFGHKLDGAPTAAQRQLWEDMLRLHVDTVRQLLFEVYASNPNQKPRNDA